MNVCCKLRLIAVNIDTIVLLIFIIIIIYIIFSMTDPAVYVQYVGHISGLAMIRLHHVAFRPFLSSSCPFHSPLRRPTADVILSSALLFQHHSNRVLFLQLCWPRGVTHMGSRRRTRSLMLAGSPISASQTSTHGSLEKVGWRRTLCLLPKHLFQGLALCLIAQQNKA